MSGALSGLQYDRPVPLFMNMQSSLSNDDLFIKFCDFKFWIVYAYFQGQNTVIVIGDMSRAEQKSTDTMTDQELSDKKKFLFEKQAYEAAKLENDLHGEETETLEKIITDFEKKKTDAQKEAADDFADKLSKAKNDQVC